MSEETVDEQPKGQKGVSVGITEHPLYGLGIKLLVTDINGNKADLFLNVDEAINFSSRITSVSNLAFILSQIAGMMQGGGADPKIIAP